MSDYSPCGVVLSVHVRKFCCRTFDQWFAGERHLSLFISVVTKSHKSAVCGRPFFLWLYDKEKQDDNSCNSYNQCGGSESSFPNNLLRVFIEEIHNKVCLLSLYTKNHYERTLISQHKCIIKNRYIRKKTQAVR
jgi:hypothetical protein